MQNESALTITTEDNFIVNLTNSRNIQYCSMVPQTEDEEIILYNAMNNPEKRIGDCINKTIQIQHVFCEVVQVSDKNTGELTDLPRIVLIDEKGIGYACTSMGIYSALKKIFSIKGLPDSWIKPISVEIQQITKGDRKLLTLKMVK